MGYRTTIILSINKNSYENLQQEIKDLLNSDFSELEINNNEMILFCENCKWYPSYQVCSKIENLIENNPDNFSFLEIDLNNGSIEYRKLGNFTDFSKLLKLINNV